MNQSGSVITRFAPSPSGLLHLGHAFSAKAAHDFARERGGKFLLRIEDIDTGRCKAEFEEAIMEDLHWLGLTWDGPVRRQSDHSEDYRRALQTLDQKGLLYPCFCTRKDIMAEIAHADHAPHGPEGPLYPGICRALSPAGRQEKIDRGVPYALRLDLARAREMIAGDISWTDIEKGEQIATPEILGDAVLARKDIPTSYHLSVVVDDDIQNVTHIIRGSDLFHASHLHRLLQEILGLKIPTYHHHGLLVDQQGQRLAKRNQSMTLRSLREQGKDPHKLFLIFEDYSMV